MSLVLKLKFVCLFTKDFLFSLFQKAYIVSIFSNHIVLLTPKICETLKKVKFGIFN